MLEMLANIDLENDNGTLVATLITEEGAELLRAKIAEKGLNVIVKTRYPRKFFKNQQEYYTYAQEKFPMLKEFISTLGLKADV